MKEVKNAEFMSVSGKNVIKIMDDAEGVQILCFLGQFPLLKTDSGPVEGFAQLLKFVSDRVN